MPALLGSGRTELARLLFGLDAADSGEVVVDGERVTLKDPAHAIAHGMALCPEERKSEGLDCRSLGAGEHRAGASSAQGLVPSLSVKEQQAIADRFVEALGIKTAVSKRLLVSFQAATSRRRSSRAGWRPSRGF